MEYQNMTRRGMTRRGMTWSRRVSFESRYGTWPWCSTSDVMTRPSVRSDWLVEPAVDSDSVTPLWVRAPILTCGTSYYTSFLDPRRWQ